MPDRPAALVGDATIRVPVIEEGAMGEGLEPTDEFEVILGIAEALREEFGDGIDAHPGGAGSEPGQINRAFRTTVRHLFASIVLHGDELPRLLTWVLRCAAERRLVCAGVSGPVAETSMDLEPDLGDAWIAYLALAPSTVIRDFLDAAGRD
jgi:hypothetical protein